MHDNYSAFCIVQAGNFRQYHKSKKIAPRPGPCPENCGPLWHWPRGRRSAALDCAGSTALWIRRFGPGSESGLPQVPKRQFETCLKSIISAVFGLAIFASPTNCLAVENEPSNTNCAMVDYCALSADLSGGDYGSRPLDAG